MEKRESELKQQAEKEREKMKIEMEKRESELKQQAEK